MSATGSVTDVLGRPEADPGVPGRPPDEADVDISRGPEVDADGPEGPEAYKHVPGDCGKHTRSWWV